MTEFRELAGLPPYGPMATSFPASFAKTGREGYVLEVSPDFGDAWVGNFARGLGGHSGAYAHPNGSDLVVFAGGSGYVIDPRTHTLREEFGHGVVAHVWKVTDPPGLICDRQGLAFFRIGSAGILWHTRRLSWDGFRDVALTPTRITGLAWGLGDAWVPFSVELAGGSSAGGSIQGAGDFDWEVLAKGSTERSGR